LQTTKMKNTTVCATCRRSLLVSRSGRIRSMAAPVVPMKLASRPPTVRKAVLVEGVAARSPSIRTPPETQYSENKSMMKGTYSASRALASTVPTRPQEMPPTAGSVTEWAGKWRSTGWGCSRP